MEALASDEPNFATAAKYLTTAARRTWRPASQTIVVNDSVEPYAIDDGDDSAVAGQEVGAVDGDGFYRATQQRYSHDFDLTRENGQWRIGAPPHGIVLHQLDFQRMYDTPDSLFYPNPSDPTHQVIPCQVYLRDGDGTATTLTRTFLAGPCPSLDGLLTQLPALSRDAAKHDIAVTSGTAQIHLVSDAQELGSARLDELAAALCATLQQVGVSAVRLTAGSRSILVNGATPLVKRYTRSPGSDPSPAYFVNGGRVYELDINGRRRELAYGSGLARQMRFGAVAVSPDQRSVAAISADGRQVFVGSPDSPKPALWYAGSGLASPGWDAQNDLWLLAADGSSTDLLRFAAGTKAGVDGLIEPAQVALNAVPGTVRRVRVAPDGVRCALLYETTAHTSAAGVIVVRADPPQRDGLPRPVRQQTGFTASFSRVLSQFGTVDDLAWSSFRTITAVGRLPDAVSQVLAESYDDGSPAQTAPPALASTTSIAATAGSPLLAAQDPGGHQVIDALSPEGAWTEVSPGSAPVYPG